jgi:hypothetical protein
VDLAFGGDIVLCFDLELLLLFDFIGKLDIAL